MRTELKREVLELSSDIRRLLENTLNDLTHLKNRQVHSHIKQNEAQYSEVKIVFNYSETSLNVLF